MSKASLVVSTWPLQVGLQAGALPVPVALIAVRNMRFPAKEAPKGYGVFWEIKDQRKSEAFVDQLLVKGKMGDLRSWCVAPT